MRGNVDRVDWQFVLNFDQKIQSQIKNQLYSCLFPPSFSLFIPWMSLKHRIIIE